MQTFRQWHDEKHIFYRELKLNFCQCNEKQNLNLSELLRLTTDTGVEDYRQQGMSWQFLKEHQLGILLSRVAFRFHKMPKVDNFITISTWEETPEPLQLIRGYTITSDTDELLVSGISSWLIVNLETRKLVRTKDFTLREPPDFKLPCRSLEAGKIILPRDLQLLNDRPIRYSDIDANGHVNNSRYGAYVVDSLPDEYQNKEYTDFRINYAHEAKKGDILHIYGSFDDNTKKIVITGKQDGGTCFDSELYYS